MAQKVSITLVDDIDESEASETVSFGLDGTSYEIDLNDTHAAELRDALAPYVGHARKSGTSRGARKSPSNQRRASSSDDGPSAKDVREWARSNGWDVPDRGRVSSEVREAYDAAH
ncbi:Lsr2 family protein [Nocardioides sp. CFH 31398]|uniref:histone-like nucleoid-structuring protein Lsr2 n=1 Tax=Nocardioides sp. CFH 31398 TaxID=2919579 RepID=UPI001F05A995|nr:Lsr2 family protein [Nocardioides sp. CFH 31398]MCH1866129.1 Lsr2 family protein [Nocardioides sp. CFH 31398]